MASRSPRLRLAFALAFTSAITSGCGGSGDGTDTSTSAIHTLSAAQACAALNGLKIEPQVISLPTSGATVTKTTLVPATGAGETRVGEYCSVDGEIAPVNRSAPPITFNVALPSDWNKKAMHLMGGGWDGTVVPGSSAMVGAADRATPLARGYAAFGSDSGHSSNGLDGSFSMNDEAAENFMGDQLRKTRDTAVHLMSQRYGSSPTRTYSSGGSGGGREALYVADRWPTLYDGVVAYYPVWSAGGGFSKWIYLAQGLAAPGAFMNPAKQTLVWQSVTAACDALDGATDGLVSNIQACNFSPAVLRCPNGADTGDTCLSDPQIAVLNEGFGAKKALPYALANGVDMLPAFNTLNGAAPPDRGQFAPAMPANPAMPFAHALSDNYIRYLLMRDPTFDSLSFNLTASGYIQQRTKYISSRMDVNPNMTPLANKGGKVIIVHGSADPLISADWADLFKAKAQDAMGATAVQSFLKYYRVPGYGHGAGGVFTVSADTLTALEKWVEQGVAPEGLVARDTTAATAGRTRPLCESPLWPKYNGTGDINQASSFTCAH